MFTGSESVLVLIINCNPSFSYQHQTSSADRAGEHVDYEED